MGWPKGKKNPEQSERMLGKKNPMFGKKRPEMSGENNPMKRPEVREKSKGKHDYWKDKHHSEETRKKMRASLKGRISGMKDKKHSRETCERISESQKGKKRPEHGKRMKGKKNPSWNDGSSFLPYSPNFTDELKSFIKNRDNNECQNPYCSYKTKKLTIHHINYDKQGCSQFNLITLCNSCNSKANANRGEWQKLYKKIIWSKY